MIAPIIKTICTAFLHNNHQIISGDKNICCEYYVRIPAKNSIALNKENLFDANKDYL